MASAAFNLFASVLPFPELRPAAQGLCQLRWTSATVQCRTSGSGHDHPKAFLSGHRNIGSQAPEGVALSLLFIPGNIGAGLPSSEQTPLPKVSVHAVARHSVHGTAPVIRLIRPHNLWLLWVCAFPATRLSQPVSLWLLVARRRCFQTSRGSPAPNNICSCFRNDLAVSV